MVLKRFLSIALAGLLVVTSIGAGNLTAYAGDLDPDSISITDLEDDATNFQEEGVSDEIVVEDQLEEEAEESDEIIIEDDAEDAIEEATEEDAVVITDDIIDTVIATFNANGGVFENNEETFQVSVAKGGLLTETIAPVKTGYRLDGWFLDQELTKAVDFATYEFVENSVFYAKWQEKAEGDDDEEGYDSIVRLTLNANGGVFPSGKSILTLGNNTSNLSSDREKPTRSGKVFAGWYAEKDCKTLLSEKATGDRRYFLNEDPPVGSIIYAGWTDAYTVTLVFGSDSGTDPGKSAGYYYKYDDKTKTYAHFKKIAVEVPKGESLSDYMPIGYSRLYIRNTDYHYAWDGNWYTDEDRTQIVALTSFVPTQNTTLYAGYENKYWVVTFKTTDKNSYFEYESYDYSEIGTGKYDSMFMQAMKNFSTYLTVGSNVVHENPKMAIEGFYYDEACKNRACGLSEGVNITEDTVLYIKWHATNKVVTFDLNSDTAFFIVNNSATKKTEIVEKSIQIGTDGSREGFYPGTVKNSDVHNKFLGWSTNKDATAPDAGFEITEDGSQWFYAQFDKDTTLYAVWDKTAYKVVATFDAKDGTVDWDGGKVSSYSVRVIDGKIQYSPLNPVPNDSSFVFEGWYNGDTKVTSWYNISLTKDTTFTAHYAKAVSLTLKANGGYFYDYSYGTYSELDTKVIRIPAGGKYSIDDPYTYENKEFGGWYYDEKCTNPLGSRNITTTKDVTLYARWLNIYTVTFDAQDGILEENSSAVFYVTQGYNFKRGTYYGSNAVPDNPVPNDSSKVFQGWYKEKEGTNKLNVTDILDYVVTGNTVLYAKYSSSFNVTFDVGTNGGSFVSHEGGTYVAKIAQNENLRSKVPAVKSTDTKVFKGWFTKPIGGDEIKNVYSYKVTADVTLYAQFTECYVLTFHANQDGAVLDNGKAEQKVLVTKGTALRYGADDEDYDELYDAPGLDYSKVTTGKVPLIIGSNSAVWTTTADGSGTLYVLSSSSHRYYTDDGASHSFNMYGFVPTSDMDFYAKWGDPVKVTFDANGGGLFKNEKQYDKYGVLSADRTKRVLTVPKGILFNNIDRPYSYCMDSTDESKDQVSFYYSDKECKNSIRGDFVIEKDLTVYGRWYASGGGSNSSKTVILHSQEGYFGDPYHTMQEQTYSLNSSRGTSSLPTINDPNKAFKGWFTDEKAENPYGEQYYQNGSWYVVYNKDVTDLYAGYGPTFTVKLDANGGYFDESYIWQKDPSEITRELTSVTLKPGVSGYGVNVYSYTSSLRRDGDMVFGGWYEDEAFTKKAVLTHYYTSGEYYTPKANVTLYAKWVSYDIPTKITATADKTELKVGENAKLTAKLEGIADDKAVNWFIESSSISLDDRASNKYSRYPVEVASDGTAKAIAAGSVTAYAYYNGVKSNLVTITVTSGNVPTSIVLSTDKLTLGVDDEETVTATVTPSTKASAVTWSSSNAGVATVTGSGATATIKGIKKGTAKITAKVDGKSASLEVTVEEKSKAITLSQEAISLTAAPDNKAEITATLGKDFQGKKVLWSSSVPEVATVLADASDSTKAVIDPVDEIEETKQTTITATIEGTEESAKCIVTVRPVGKAIAPYADTPSGTVKKGTLVSLYTDTLGADIFYTLDGTEPGTKAEGATKAYDDAIAITEDTTIKALAYQEGVKVSAVATFTYTVDKDWGDISEVIAKKVFGNDITKVENGIWYLINEKEYKAAGKTGLVWKYSGEKDTFNAIIEVYNNTTKLAENRDYTITYSNNLNAAKETDEKAPKFTIKGKGLYNASADFFYTIEPDDINDAVMTSEDDIAVVAGKSKLSSVKVTLAYGDKTLKAGKDYKFTYKADGKEIDAATVLNTAGKTYTIEIAGIGNFTGNYKKVVTVEVIKNDSSVVPASKLKAVDANGKALTAPYTGKAVDVISKFDNSKAENKPEWFVVNGKTKLIYGTDYTIELPSAVDDDFVSAGEHKFVIKGIRKTAEGQVSYIGSKNCTYTILGTDIKKVKFTSFSKTVAYTGELITLDDLGTIKLTNSSTKKDLVKGKDYDALVITYATCGKIQVMFFGLGEYYGYVIKTVTVKARKLTDKEVTITVNNDKDVAFAKGGVKPEVTVTLKNGKELLQNADYKVSYKNNSKVGDKGAGKKAPTVVIKGAGNYAGTSLTKTFTITKANVSQISVVAKDVVYNEKGKAGYFLVVPKLMDNGKNISAGKGKDVEKIAKTDYIYTYLAQTKLVGGKIKAAGDTVDKNDKVPANTTIVVTVPVKCSDKSSYKADVPEIVGYYRVVAKDLSKAKIKVKDASKSKLVVNGGEAVKLLKSDLTVTVGKTTVDSKEFEIVSITNNKFLGTATLTIRGKGNYGGTKSVNIKISAKSIKK